MSDDITLATNADDATADTQNARLQIDVLATQFAHLPEPQSTKGCQRDRHRKSGRHSLGERLDLVQRGWRDLPDPRVCSTTLDPAGVGRDQLVAHGRLKDRAKHLVGASTVRRGLVP